MQNHLIHNRGIAFGVFDIFHIGHLRYLQSASSLCKELYVGVRSDKLKTPGKTREVIFNESLRCELINGLACIHNAFIFERSLDEIEFWIHFFKKKNISIVFAGEDWKDTPRWINLEIALKQNNIALHFIPRTQNVSSSMIFNRKNMKDSEN